MSPELTLVPHETTTHTPDPAVLKRCAIIGTAPSWKQCPWDDLGLEKWTLNDGYLMGVPFVAGATHRHFDLHPVHQMYFRNPNQAFDPAQVPLGVYVRPQGHLEWLRTRPYPVFLADPRPDMPTSRAFPKQALLDFFADIWPLRRQRDGTITPGPDYEVSTPTWMLMQAIAEGYREVHIYGIHLATEWEYVQQRPNMEFLIGYARGRGVRIVLPHNTPLCKASYRYAFDPKSDLPVQEAAQRCATIKQRGAVLKDQLAKVPLWQITKRRTLETQIQRQELLLADARQVQSRAQVALTAKGAIV